MRRAEEEYFATKWAINKCKEYGLVIQDGIIKDYQDYIDLEMERGKKCGATRNYGLLRLKY